MLKPTNHSSTGGTYAEHKLRGFPLQCWQSSGQAAQAQTYTLKIKNNPDVGKSAESREVEKMTATVKISDSTGKVLAVKEMTQNKEECLHP